MLSHDHFTVESGLSINKEIMTNNMKELTLTSKRLIKDYIMTVGSVEYCRGNPYNSKAQVTKANKKSVTG